ncbi:MAG: prepilin peptidase [Planctomycetia bacterium]|nr:prepilin peptidase [Planctomycetia bacterium]
MPFTAPWIVHFPGAEIATVTLAFAWGATVGSFINVVVHRLPRGESPVSGRSHCPKCGSAIRARDNVPVLGWLLLRGRCRDCDAAISPRYPLVEAACGALTAAVAAAELVGGGRWLPLLADASGRGIDRLLLLGDWPLLISCGLHAAILMTMLAWSLLAVECGSLACRGSAAAIVGVILVVVVTPLAGPVGVLPDGGSWPPSSPPWPTLVASVAGVALGAVAGRLTGGVVDGCCLALLGAALGWQAVVVVTVGTSAIRWVTTAVGAASNRRPHPGAPGIPAIVTAAAVQILCWHPILTAWRHVIRFMGGS